MIVLQVFREMDRWLFTGREPLARESNRAFAYVLSLATGFAAGLARTSSLPLWADRVFTMAAITGVVMAVTEIVCSTNDLKCRSERMLRCALILVGSLSCATILNEHFVFGSAVVYGAIAILAFATAFGFYVLRRLWKDCRGLDWREFPVAGGLLPLVSMFFFVIISTVTGVMR